MWAPPFSCASDEVTRRRSMGRRSLEMGRDEILPHFGGCDTAMGLRFAWSRHSASTNTAENHRPFGGASSQKA
jgi:hypothetical protein